MRAPTVLAFFLTGTLCSAHVAANPPGPAAVAPPSCAVTEPPAVWYKGKAEGCQYDPDPKPCIADDILTLPCGCKTATKVARPPAPGKQNCHVGYMYTTTATNCC
ncbi:hypothetical protein C2857_007768 [Epichloe festucae Fl1]|uniref:Uncharacterized protein n=1 Tax=Epichloe festucae (strain Fl1) TaxID=877507 RepID=A0A7S9PT80_EPIFF|nr:hypothetical protein C2857_007768 [Epichloe festucae Fl1]